VLLGCRVCLANIPILANPLPNKLANKLATCKTRSMIVNRQANLSGLKGPDNQRTVGISCEF